MRNVIIGTLAFAAAAGAFAGDFLFVGISRPPLANDRECPRFELVTQETDTEAEAKAFLRDFLKDPARRDTSVDIYKAGQVVMLYRYLGRSSAHGSCQYQRYSRASGRTETAARAAIASNVRTWKENYLGPPEVVKVWGLRKGTGDVVTADNLGGVRIEYRVHRREDGSTVLAKVLNGNPRKAARVTFKVAGEAGSTVEVPPGSTYNTQLGKTVRSFRVEVNFVPHRETGKSLGREAMDAAKGMVRDYVTDDEGKVKPAKYTTGGGVRG